MKISKKQLKDLIKECLVEILAEGLGQEALEEVRTFKKAPGRTPPKRAPGPPQPSPLLERAVAESAGGNPIMASILADTARTTLPTMLSSDGPNSGGAGMQQVEQVRGNPEDIFGSENAGEGGRWSDLAFAQPTTRSVPAPSQPTKLPDSFLDRPVSPNKLV